MRKERLSITSSSRLVDVRSVKPSRHKAHDFQPFQNILIEQTSSGSKSKTAEAEANINGHSMNTEYSN